MDEKNQLLTTNIWLNYVWNDANLMWNDVRTKHNKTYENLHSITKHNKTYENLHNKTYITKRKTKQKICSKQVTYRQL
jgi:hypothetical protein